MQFFAPDDGRKNRLKHVVRLTEINKLWNAAYCWLYSANILAMHGHMNVKLKPLFSGLSPLLPGQCGTDPGVSPRTKNFPFKYHSTKCSSPFLRHGCYTILATDSVVSRTLKYVVEKQNTYIWTKILNWNLMNTAIEKTSIKGCNILFFWQDTPVVFRYTYIEGRSGYYILYSTVIMHIKQPHVSAIHT